MVVAAINGPGGPFNIRGSTEPLAYVATSSVGEVTL